MSVAVVTVAGLVVLLALRAFFLAPEGWSTLAPDEAQRAWHALQISEGRLLYRDLWVQYTPVSFYWHAAAFSIFGPSLGAIRLALVATGTFTLALISVLARRVGGTAGAVAAGALFLSFGIPTYNSGYPAWEAMALSMAALAVALRWRTSKGAFAAGLLAGVSVMAKINVGALSVLALMTLYSMECSRGIRIATGLGALGIMAWLLRSMPPLESFVQFMLPLGAALALTLRSPPLGLPLAVAAAGAGVILACLVGLAPFAFALGVSPVVHAVIAEPLRFSRLIAYDSPVLRLGLPVYGATVCWAAALILPTVAPRLWPVAVGAASLGAAALLMPGVPMGIRFLLAPMVVLAATVQQWRRVSAPLLAATVWAAFLHGQVYPGQSGMHLAWALIPVWPVLAGVVRTAALRTKAAWLLPLGLFAAQTGHGALVYVQTDWAELAAPRGGIAAPRREVEALAAVSARIRDETSVLDLTSGCLVAFLAERACPLRHAYFWRGFLTEKDQEEETATLAGDPPPVAVRRVAGRDQYRWDAIARYAPILAEWVDSLYGSPQRFGPYEVVTLAP